MKQKRPQKSLEDKLITKPVTMRPALIAEIAQYAKEEDRTFSQMARILLEQAITTRARQPQPETPVQAWQSFS